jgi:cytoskeletal protein RodZ
MKGNEQPLSFGRYLRAVRREKGIGLEKISRETRIGLETLNLIEQEDLSGLPAEVFAKGFIRSYAKAVGADADRAVAGYLQSLAKLQKSEQSEADLDRLSNRFWPHMMLAAGILIVVIAGSIFALSGLQEKKAQPVVSESPEVPPAAIPEKKAPQQTAADVKPAEPAAESTEIGSADTAVQIPTPPEIRAGDLTEGGDFEEAPAAVKQILEITAVAETWMKIVIDDEKTKEVTLNPGDRLALEASAGYDLLIGNAAGVRMQLNGEPIQLTGKSGQVRSLSLP